MRRIRKTARAAEASTPRRGSTKVAREKVGRESRFSSYPGMVDGSGSHNKRKVERRCERMNMAGEYVRLASAIGEAVDDVKRAIAIRDTESIENFGDLTLILSELKSLRERANTTRFVERKPR